MIHCSLLDNIHALGDDVPLTTCITLNSPVVVCYILVITIDTAAFYVSKGLGRYRKAASRGRRWPHSRRERVYQFHSIYSVRRFRRLVLCLCIKLG